METLIVILLSPSGKFTEVNHKRGQYVFCHTPHPSRPVIHNALQYLIKRQIISALDVVGVKDNKQLKIAKNSSKPQLVSLRSMVIFISFYIQVSVVFFRVVSKPKFCINI
jgi:hypothetical protein